ncbi:MAG TPA: ABC transporter substrate-binding protein [Bryobacteraceae bacterium]|jgi:peptide/nickel transport system substrate-binding protein
MRFARTSFVLICTAALAGAAAATDHAPLRAGGGGGEPVWGGELRFAIHAEPKTWDPLLAADDATDAIRVLTGGYLVRLNRKTQKHEAGLAESWKISPDGRKIEFLLRSGVQFSDGTPFKADDVAYTLKRAIDPNLHAPIGDSIRATAGDFAIAIAALNRIILTFAAPVANPIGMLDSLPIVSSHNDKAVLGPFELAEYKPGAYVLLKRNPYYWRTVAQGRRLPYLDGIRLDIQTNRDIELQRFRKGEFQLMEAIDADSLNRITSEMGAAAVEDLGPAFENEMFWFNEKPDAPIPAYKKDWFQSRNFRRAIAESIHLDDIVRLAYQGRATAAAGIISKANQFWMKQGLAPHAFNLASARKRLAQDGFHSLEGQPLTDRAGHLVEFSVVTTSGGKTRTRIAALLQDDLAKIGIKLNIVPLDFPSMLERIARTANYESALLGLVGEDVDPAGEANVWLSGAPQHMWNPGQKQPATAWEAEIDKLIAAQAATADQKKRKAAFDRIQQIIWDEAPVIHLVNRNALVAISPRLGNSQAAVLNPHVFWNADVLYLIPEKKP